MKYQICPNTDTVDIDAQCVGLTVRTDGPDKLSNSRGLHIQIRHNQDKATFEAACKLQGLIAAAPELLAIAKEFFQAYCDADPIKQERLADVFEQIIMKAEGKAKE